MESIDYYTNSKTSWLSTDDEELIKKYNEDYDIIQLGRLFKKTPGQVAYRLQKLKVISSTMCAKGYNDYKESDLYKSIANDFKIKRQASKDKEKALHPNITVNLQNNDISLLRSEVNEMKLQMNLINKNVEQMLKLINLLYDFETQ